MELFFKIMSDAIIFIGEFICVFFPVMFVGYGAFAIIRSHRRKNQMMQRIADELPGIDNPANQYEAIMRGIQRAMRQ